MIDIGGLFLENNRQRINFNGSQNSGGRVSYLREIFVLYASCVFLIVYLQFLISKYSSLQRFVTSDKFLLCIIFCNFNTRVFVICGIRPKFYFASFPNAKQVSSVISHVESTGTIIYASQLYFGTQNSVFPITVLIISFRYKHFAMQK